MPNSPVAAGSPTAIVPSVQYTGSAGVTVRPRSGEGVPRAPVAGRKARALVLAGAMRTVIERRLPARRLDCPLIFHRDGRPLKDFRRPWRDACQAAGVPGKLFHDLRRTGVRNLVRSGATESVAMRISGHTTTSMFRRYNITTEADLQAAAEKVFQVTTEL